jgi:UDP-N-acetylmuramate dehydrogenase
MQIRENISLRPFNTFGIDVQAKYFAGFNSIEQLEEVFSLKQADHDAQLVLGGGSNILFTSDFDGLVLKNEIRGISVEAEDEESVFIKAGAGENWHGLVMFAVENGYAGLENLSLIPGNVGASPMQNIGAYGVEIGDVFHELEAFHKKEKMSIRFSREDCEFGYRDSVFKRKYRDQFVITSVTYRLNKVPHFNTSYGAIRQELEKMGVSDLSIKAVSQAVINIRSSKLPDPAVIGNAGSFFKNPQIDNSQFQQLKQRFPDVVAFPVNDQFTKVAAGWLIEQCGWKGFRRGDAGCYAKQALVLVNYGNAKGDELYSLSEEIVQSVKERFDIELEREVNII